MCFCASYSETGVEMWDRISSALRNCRCYGGSDKETDVQAPQKISFLLCDSLKENCFLFNKSVPSVLREPLRSCPFGAQQGVRAVRLVLCISVKKGGGISCFLFLF